MDYRVILGPMDLVCFAGRGFYSTAIRASAIYDSLKSLSPRSWANCYSHVGLVGPCEDSLFESTTLNTEPCSIMGEKVRGVSLVSLADRINNFRGSVTVYRLRIPLDLFEESKYNELVRLLVGRPYEKNPGALLNAFALDYARFVSKRYRSHYKAKNAETIFCSELVGLALQSVRQIEDPDGTNVTPVDLVNRKKYQKIWDTENPIHFGGPGEARPQLSRSVSYSFA